MNDTNYIGYSDHVINWLQAILLERFGHHFRISQSTVGSLNIHLSEESGMIRFDTLIPDFFTASSDLPYSEWDATNDSFTSTLNKPLPVPGISSLSSPMIEKNKDGYCIHYDILGLAYWMLTRQEEVGNPMLDDHGRFPATSSHAYRYGYLDRPVVDEWFDVLGQVITRQWPQLKLKQHQPQTIISCDVDAPYLCYSKSLKSTARTMIGDVLKRRSLQGAIKTFYRYIQVLQGHYNGDPYMTAIEWIMDVNEQEGNKVAFYFISEHLHATYDGCYNMNEPVIRNLLQRIHARGHEIGLHTSYTSYQNMEQTRHESETLRKVMAEEGISQAVIGGRQHYLRWETPATARNLAASGMTYDTTLGYADSAGFRCGSCHEYPMFDPVKGEALSLRQRPLILMETTVISGQYMGFGYSEETLKLMESYKQTCYKFGGNFTLLWHNSHLITAKDRNYYETLIRS